jgi:hypothetical protein
MSTSLGSICASVTGDDMKLISYYGTGTANGLNVTIKTHIIVGWISVGGGTFENVSDYSVGFVGSVKVKGEINSVITLTDGSPTAPKGPCTVVMNNDTYSDGLYEAQGDSLNISFDSNSQSYSITHDDSTTIVTSNGHTVQFVPSN